jgi:hypothetical protein
MVGAIGFEPSVLQSFEVFAGLGWHRKDRDGSQGNNNWTWIGHANRIALWATDQQLNEIQNELAVARRIQLSVRNGGICSPQRGIAGTALLGGRASTHAPAEEWTGFANVEYVNPTSMPRHSIWLGAARELFIHQEKA